MKRLTILKNRSDEEITASSPHFIASSLRCWLNTIQIHEEIVIKQCRTFKHILYVKGKMTKFFAFATEKNYLF